MNLIPLVPCTAAMVAMAPAAQRDRRPIRRRCSYAAPRIRSSSALTMEVGIVPVAGATSAISTFVQLLALSYLYVG
jgi:hypothetical protein